MTDDHGSDRPRAREDLIFRELDDEWVLYDGAGRQLHVLNRTAAVVWVCCTGELTRDEIVDEVLGAFDDAADRARVATDVAQALAGFRERSLLA